jgi:chemotaxis regulatin CheY-phosphate phosphatase CheZ
LPIGEDIKQNPTNDLCNPTTDSVIREMHEIRQNTDWKWVQNLQMKYIKIKNLIAEFKKSLAWATNGTQLSNSNLNSIIFLILGVYVTLSNFKGLVTQKIQEYVEKAKGRLLRTSRLNLAWRNSMHNASAQEAYKTEKSKNLNKLLKNDYRVFDLKNTARSEVK